MTLFGCRDHTGPSPAGISNLSLPVRPLALPRTVKIERPGQLPKIPALICLLVGLALIGLPLRILQFGYLPPDDALRHAAKAINGKSWQEIMVMRPDITIDHNPGWHSVLGVVHRAANWDQRALVRFSVVAMFLVFAAAPLAWLKRPEAWFGALAIVLLAMPYFADRAFIGRPLFLTMGVTLAILLLWRTPEAKVTSWPLRVLTVALLAISTWVHGSWYLLPLLPLVFFVAREWKKGLELTGCWFLGTILGAILTGAPWEFLRQSALIPFLALGQTAPTDSLVGEFQSFKGDFAAVVIVALVLVWRRTSGRSLAALGRDPVFWMMIAGWLFGFRVVRFWLDWGIPALALWLALQIEELLETHVRPNGWPRVGLSFLAALILLAGVANNRGERWSQYGNWSTLDASKPEHAGWVPGEGGILYSVNLSVFYQMFFQNPHGSWRYALGFEPSFMTPENLAVYQELWATLNALRACAPWVQKMTPVDRLVLVGGPQPQPAIPELEWYYAAENLWVGRLPRRDQTVPEISTAVDSDSGAKRAD